MTGWFRCPNCEARVEASGPDRHGTCERCGWSETIEPVDEIARPADSVADTILSTMDAGEVLPDVQF